MSDVTYVVQKRLRLFGQWYERGDVLSEEVISQWRTFRSFLGRDVVAIPASYARTTHPNAKIPVPTNEPAAEPVVDDTPVADDLDADPSLAEEMENDEVKAWLEEQGVTITGKGWCELPDGRKVQGYANAVEALEEG